MDVDPEEEEGILDAFPPMADDAKGERIEVIESTEEWTQMRDDMVVEMFEEWRAIRGMAGNMDKRFWSNEENEAFVGFVEEFVVDATRLDCGQFKNATFEKLALKMIQTFSNCTLTTKHCKNKHKRMKEKYQYAADMLAAADLAGTMRSSVLRWTAGRC
ncbi:hypothetical protein PIB30_061761 [Stylosanthes scabra]|uniref:Myb/SANT-like DNA-binding domain-containing protein n=1 Tax=Stylosanthes scabra TaxID=79078 RepID=A0ABU6XIS3_9FABA|nr:hypothetical protein [Stylosanthes scabra]